MGEYYILHVLKVLFCFTFLRLAKLISNLAVYTDVEFTMSFVRKCTNVVLLLDYMIFIIEIVLL